MSTSRSGSPALDSGNDDPMVVPDDTAQTHANPRAALLASLGPPSHAMTRLPGGSVDAGILPSSSLTLDVSTDSVPRSGASTPGSSSSWILLDEEVDAAVDSHATTSIPHTKRPNGSWWTTLGLQVVTSEPSSPTMTPRRTPTEELVEADSIKAVPDEPDLGPPSLTITPVPDSDVDESESVPSLPPSLTGSYIDVDEATTTATCVEEVATPRIVNTKKESHEPLPASPSELRRQARVKESRAALKQLVMSSTVMFGAALVAGAIIGVRLWASSEPSPLTPPLGAEDGGVYNMTSGSPTPTDAAILLDPYIGCTTENGVPCHTVAS